MPGVSGSPEFFWKKLREGTRHPSNKPSHHWTSEPSRETTREKLSHGAIFCFHGYVPYWTGTLRRQALQYFCHIIRCIYSRHTYAWNHGTSRLKSSFIACLGHRPSEVSVFWYVNLSSSKRVPVFKILTTLALWVLLNHTGGQISLSNSLNERGTLVKN